MSNIINCKVGEVSRNRQGVKMWIKEYRSSRDVDVEFEDGYIAYSKEYKDFKIGNIKSRFHPCVKGVGYIGDAKTRINGIKEKSYICWISMLTRCYDEKYHKRFPSYKDIVVCKEWHNYSNFKKWYDENYYEIENEKMCLDKDILVKNNKVYSPETCVFVPEQINFTYVSNSAIRGDLPVGVSKQTKGQTVRYIANLSIKGNMQYLGRFKTPEEAFVVYKKAKESYVRELADKYKNKIPEKLYEAMCNYKVEITD